MSIWANRRLVLRQSPLHGAGTFAIEAMAVGEALFTVTGGLLCSPEARQEKRLALAEYLYNEDILPSGESIVTPKVFYSSVSHPNDPNAVDLASFSTVTQSVALRNLQAGEEEITASSVPPGDPRWKS